jgi:hypothetical protein
VIAVACVVPGMMLECSSTADEKFILILALESRAQLILIAALDAWVETWNVYSMPNHLDEILGN